MGMWYKFIRPYDMKVLDEGHFVDMPFSRLDLPFNIGIYPDHPCSAAYDSTMIMDRQLAEVLQTYMTENKTMFTDLMNEYDTECLIVRIE